MMIYTSEWRVVPMAAMTPTRIEQSIDAYATVAEYFHELRISADEQHARDIPLCAADVLRVFDLDSEFHNGGLWQYFSNRTDDDGQVFDEVLELSQALNRMGAIELGTLMTSATQYWQKTVERVGEDMRNGIEDAHLQLFEQGEPQIELFDEQLAALYERACVIIAEYIRCHANDFCN